MTLENYTYMTLTHLLKCNFRTLVHIWHLKTTLTWHSNTCLHVTLKHLPYMWQLNTTLSWHSNTYMTLKHLHDTQTLEHTSRNLMYSISTCVTFKHFHYKTCKHDIVAILKCNPTTLHVISVSSFQVYITTIKVKEIVLSPSIHKTLPQCTG